MILSKEYQICVKECISEVFQNMKIYNGVVLVTGATGLIGSAFVDCLLCMNDIYKTKYKVIAISKSKKRAKERFEAYFSRNDFEFISCDVNYMIPEVGEIDYLIHMASNTHPFEYSNDPIGTIRTNIIGTDNLLNYAKNHHIKRFVFLSSVEIYGENIQKLDSFSELDMGYINCNKVRAGYPESKRVGESLCRAYEKIYGVDVVIPRICRVYGPTMWEDDSKALAQFIRRAVVGQDIILKSEGKQFYSYIHVMDAVKAIFYIMYNGKSGEAYNVSSQFSNIRLIDLAYKLAEIADVNVCFEIPDEKESEGYSVVTRAILNNKKLISLGWKETYDLDNGLKMTVRILKEIADGRYHLDTAKSNRIKKASTN